jgi:large subunit ribosomal protein L29
MKASAVREFSSDELRDKENELTQQLFTLRLQQATQGQVENPARVRQIRRDLARVLTILRQRQVGAA